MCAHTGRTRSQAKHTCSHSCRTCSTAQKMQMEKRSGARLIKAHLRPIGRSGGEVMHAAQGSEPAVKNKVRTGHLHVTMQGLHGVKPAYEKRT